MAHTSSTHFLFFGVPSLGHIRPFFIFAARLVNENENIIITMLLSPKFLDKANAEIAAELGEEGGASEDVRRRIRVLSAFQSDSNNLVEVMKVLAESSGDVYRALVQAQPITCAVKGTVFDAVPAPSAVIVDFFAFPLAPVIRGITGRSIPILAWITGHTSTRLRLFSPESMGGLGDAGAKTDAEAARLGTTSAEVGDKFFASVEGKVVNVPGVPTMHDYEYYPQKRVAKVPLAVLMRGIYKLLQDCDGALVVSSYDFEKESIDAFKSWFSGLNKDAYAVGPLLPLDYGTVPHRPGAGGDVGVFLDKMLIEHGQHSVLFISFGTIFWPASPDYMDEVIEALIEKKFPFIFCFASPYAKISDELAEKVKASGLGMLTPWAPQQFILNHPATGWFVTHCGQNSVLESLGSGIPMIAWPFESDQPAAAAHLMENLKVAFELIEVRTGEHGLKPLYRNGRAAKGTREAVGAEIREVIDACRGPKGQELRKNAEALKVKFAESWNADGINRKEIGKFLKKYACA